MLFKKLIRTMGKYKSQFISMVIMVVIGIGMFVGFNIEWYTLEKDVNDFLADSGFADYRLIDTAGYSAEDLDKIREIEGVDNAARYLSVNATVKDTKKVLAVTVTEDMDVSGFTLMSGEEYDEESKDGLWLSDRYAEENDISLSDTITMEYSGIEIKGTVKGLVKSGEFLVCVPDPTQLMPDFDNYGFVYISPRMLEDVMGREYYSQINVLSSMGRKDFTNAADDALNTTSLIVSKDDTISYSESMGEAEEGRTMGAIMPVIFLGIAVLTMITTMNRISIAEKTQIGTLKSLGFKDKRILRHYTSYGIFIAAAGTIPGIALGYLIGWFIMNPGGAMGTYLDMPDWSLHTPVFIWIVLAAVVLLMILVTYLSVKNILKGTPAETLRPYTPKKMRKLLLEKTPVWDRMGFGTRWNLRDTFRHKARSLMTLFGIVSCVTILTAGLGMNDTFNAFLKENYEDTILYSNMIYLDAENITQDDVDELSEKYDADRGTQISVLLNKEKTASVEIYDLKNDLVRFMDPNSENVELTDDGVYACERLKKEFDLKEGDELTFSPFGSDDEYKVRVAGFVRSSSESMIMTSGYAKEAGIPFITDILYTKDASVESESRILNVQSKDNILESFDTFTQIMYMMIVLLAGAAVILGIVVLYNLGVMSYTERYREMATLKVLGFKDKKIGKLLISQNLWMTVVGIIIGIPLGIGVLKFLLSALASEYEMGLVIGPATYLITILLTVGMSLLVSLMISRKNKKIDMVEALKTAE